LKGRKGGVKTIAWTKTEEKAGPGHFQGAPQATLNHKRRSSQAKIAYTEVHLLIKKKQDLGEKMSATWGSAGGERMPHSR